MAISADTTTGTPYEGDPNPEDKRGYFSFMLTVVATLGGIFFGTLLAMMRLSGIKFLEIPATFYVNGQPGRPRCASPRPGRSGR